jgi:hypothetical protein
MRKQKDSSADTIFKAEGNIFNYECSQALTARPSGKRILNRSFGAFIGAEGTLMGNVLWHSEVVESTL